MSDNPTTRAERIHDGHFAKGQVEDDLDDWWPSLDRITTDSYDNSLEVYFEDHIVDLEATPEQQQAIYGMGFTRFWLNFKGGRFKGGTERAYVDPKHVEIVRARVAEAEAMKT